MSIHLLHKNTFRPGYIPQPDDLVIGQLGLTIHTGEVALWTKDSAGNIVKLSGGGSGGGGGVVGPPGKDGADGKDGKDGKDGADGKPGADGADGKPGEDGKSAYEVAVDNGFEGSEEAWLESLKGEPGEPGEGGGGGTLPDDWEPEYPVYFGVKPPEDVDLIEGALFTQEDTLCQYIWTGSTWAGVTPSYTAVPGEEADLSRFYVADQYIQVQPELPAK